MDQDDRTLSDWLKQFHGELFYFYGLSIEWQSAEALIGLDDGNFVYFVIDKLKQKQKIMLQSVHWPAQMVLKDHEQNDKSKSMKLLTATNSTSMTVSSQHMHTATLKYKSLGNNSIMQRIQQLKDTKKAIGIYNIVVKIVKITRNNSAKTMSKKSRKPDKFWGLVGNENGTYYHMGQSIFYGFPTGIVNLN